MKLPLFREEVRQQRSGGWLGDIVLVRPMSHAILTSMVVVVLLATLAFVAWGEYTKKARVSGYVVPEEGLIKIYSQQSGKIVSLLAREGQKVEEGQLLAVVSSERTGEQGATQAQIARQMSVRVASLGLQTRDTRALYARERESASMRLRQIDAERSELERAIAGQKERLAIARASFEKNMELYRSSFVSELGMQERKAELLDQETRLHDLERARLVLERDAVSTETELRTSPIREGNDIEKLARQISQIESDGIENEAKRQTFVLAPKSGVLAAVQVDLGKQVATQDVLMSLIPAGTHLMVDLYVPSKSVGFVRLGNTAKLQYQAFPYQKFGTQDGTVSRISRTAVASQELPFPAAVGDMYYIVRVKPAREFVLAYGKREAIQPGMQVDADVWLDTRTLLEWILEPLYSVSGRM